MIKIYRDKENVPLVPFEPKEEDRVIGLDTWPLEGGSPLCAESHSHLNWQGRPTSVVGCTKDNIQAACEAIVKVIQNWEDAAKAKGHEYARLIFDGSDFYPIYYRRDTLVEIAALKQNARNILEFNRKTKQVKNQVIEDAKLLLGAEAEDYEDD
jgi:hypothetical protein